MSCPLTLGDNVAYDTYYYPKRWMDELMID